MYIHRLAYVLREATTSPTLQQSSTPPPKTRRSYPHDNLQKNPETNTPIGGHGEDIVAAYTFCEAIIMGVKPSPFLAATSPPASSRGWSTSGLPPCAAPWTGVFPKLSLVVIDDPALRSRWTT